MVQPHYEPDIRPVEPGRHVHGLQARPGSCSCPNDNFRGRRAPACDAGADFRNLSRAPCTRSTPSDRRGLSKVVSSHAVQCVAGHRALLTARFRALGAPERRSAKAGGRRSHASKPNRITHFLMYSIVCRLSGSISNFRNEARHGRFCNHLCYWCSRSWLSRERRTDT